MDARPPSVIRSRGIADLRPSQLFRSSALLIEAIHRLTFHIGGLLLLFMITLAELLVPLVEEFQRRHGCIRIAYLFGSYSQGCARDDSDVDVAVLLQDGADAMTDLKLGDYLSRELGKMVDVVVLNQASPILQHEVIRGGIRLMEVSPMVRRLYEVSAFRDYVDAVFFQQRRLSEVRA